jgi:Ca2+-transporting ATPase
MLSSKNIKEWYNNSINEIFTFFQTDSVGLTPVEAEQRLKRYGPNKLEEKKKVTVLKVFLSQFKNFLIYILIFAAVISYFFGERIEFIVISIIVIFIGFLGFLQEYRAEKAIEALKKLTSKKARVIRNSKEQIIDSKEIVPGDIVFLEVGDHVPADSRIIEESQFEVDESSLTGESVPVVKKQGVIKSKVPIVDRLNMVYTGTFVTNGNAKVVVVETGMNTQIGKMAKLIQDIKQDTSPLQEKFNVLSKKVGIAVIVLCVVIFLIGLLREQDIILLLITTAAVAVSGIPESLPAVVTVTLANGIKKMAKDNAVVKKMFAVETLGCTSIICTDKTGTLTKNQMSIEVIYTDDKYYSVTGEGYVPAGRIINNQKIIRPEKHKELKNLIITGVLCNNSSLEKEQGQWIIQGEPTEGSLVVLGYKTGIKKKKFDKNYARIKEFPFDPTRKCMSTIHKYENKKRAFVKGAPEVIINKCKYISKKGKVQKLTKNEKKTLLQNSHKLAEKALRILALAYKDVKNNKFSQDEVESNLTFLGIVGMRDPPREGVKEAIQLCEKAGIDVVMITGDHEITAKTIASELGIYKKHHRILTGSELNKINDKEFLHIVEHVRVYARVSPEHKIRIVEALQKREHVVAMTGDGVNDAPALKKANIGIAMGRGGTDVARESADMILLDDHFSTIVDAIKQGRTIFNNIKKFVYYLLTGNLSEVIVIFVALMLGVNLPLTALMILFINLVTSELPAMGLSMEPPRPHIMEQKPRDKKEVILDEYLLLKIAQLIPLIVFGTVTLFIWMLAIKGQSLDKSRTAAFAVLIFFELFHVYNAKAYRKSLFDSHIFANKYINLAVLFSAIITLLAIYTDIGQKIFHTVPMLSIEFIAVIAMSISILVFVEIQETIIQSEIKEWESLNIGS